MCVTNTTSRRIQALVPTKESASLPRLSRICHRPDASELLSQFASSQIHSISSNLVSDGGIRMSLHDEPLQEKHDQRPKRRRKPQPPGKTAKQNVRHFVVHNYHDHALDGEDTEIETSNPEEIHDKRRGGVITSFPLKLHEMLDKIEADGLAGVISWQPHGRAFLVHKPAEFVSTVMPKYFRQTKLTSFQRQLNLYGFCRLTRGQDNKGYYHELFLRGKPFLTKYMARTKVKGTGFKAASSPDMEPDLYSMPHVSIIIPQVSSHGGSDVSNNTAPVEHTQQPLSDWNATQHPPCMIDTNIELVLEFPLMSPIHESFHTFTLSEIPACTSNDLALNQAVEDFLSWHEPPAVTTNMMKFSQEWYNFQVDTQAVEEAVEEDAQLEFLLENFLAQDE